MNMPLDDFAKIFELADDEISALQRILATPAIMKIAEDIAETTLIPERPAPLPEYPESPELSEAFFAAAYLSCDASRQHFKRLGIPDAVWQETMTDFKLWLRHEIRYHQLYGLGPRSRHWETKILRGGIIRLGRLECELENHYRFADLKTADGKVILSAGDPVINLHIPAAGPMDIAECGKSMRRMAEFFALHRPDYQWKGFLCESWLLDLQLRPMLPPDSNILKFQGLGHNYIIQESDDIIFRIFGYDDPAAMTDPTGLQRQVWEFICSGNHFRSSGMFLPRHIAETAEFDPERIAEKIAAITLIPESQPVR